MESQLRNLFADMDEMPGLESSLGEIVDSGKIPEVLPLNQVNKNDEQERETTEQGKEGQEDKENEMLRENGNLETKEDNSFNDDALAQNADSENSPVDANNDVTKADLERKNSSGTEGERKRKDRDKKQDEVQDVRRSSRHDKDLIKKYTASSKINKRTTELNSSNILPNLRRSNRANKGVSKEMFDPSHVPSPKYRKTTNVRENSNSNDSDDSYRKSQQQNEEVEGEEEDNEEKLEDQDERNSESESDSDDEFNDPNRLWCICKKPHNDRFMISCDICKDWFHGDCVGITSQRGRQIERRGEEYVCPRCLKQQNKKKNDKIGVSLKGYAHDKKDETQKRKKSFEGESKQSKKPRKCIVSTCNNRAQADSVYCSNVCILRHAKESLVVVTKAKKDSVRKPSVEDSRQESREERITRKIREATMKGKVAVICRKTGKIFSNASAPLKANLTMFLRQNPSFQVLKVPKKSRYEDEGLRHKNFSQNVEQRKHTNLYDMDPDYKPKDLLEQKPSNPYKQHRLSTGGEIEKARKHKLEREESTEAKKLKHKKTIEQERRNSFEKHSQKVTHHKRDSRSLSDDRNETKKESPSKKDGEVRKSIQKSLMSILQNRSNNSEDLKMHPNSITKLVMKIEESLYKLFGGVTSKYKNRYRSIMFNLKDEKNEGLWRKVILGEVTSSSLVKMTAEEMASKELAQWRKHELTQELEMIHELEASKNNVRPVAKITHKGEIVINEDFSDLTESHLDTSNEKSAPTVAPQRVRRISANQPDSSSDTSLLTVDTTTQHSSHLFDMNCRICTGQVKEEEVATEETSHKKVKRSTSIILSNEAQVSTEAEQTDEELIQKISSYNKKPEKSILSPPKEKLTKKDSTDDSELEAESPEAKLVSDDAKAEPEKETDEIKYAVTNTTAVTPSKLNRDHFLWTGVISMPELASFHTNAYSVSGNTKELSNLIPLKLVLDGRIHPRVVWDYLAKVNSFPNKEVCVVQFRASSEDDRVGYVSMLSYFSSRRRFGVVSNQNTQVIKDIYLVPLLETEKIPSQLLPFKGPGIPDNHPSMLLGVIVRCLATQKKITPDIPSSASIKTEPKVKKPRTPESSDTKKSLLDRNRLLAPTMPHFTEKIKNSPKKAEHPAEEEEEYNPETADFEVLGKEDLPEDSPKHVVPKSEDDDEAYDPEKLTFEDDEDIPYDPEVEAERLENTELKALQEKQAYLEQMKQELEMKKAELAKEELTLQKQQPIALVPPQPPVATPSLVDPRMAARMRGRNKGPSAANKESPLQKIFSVLNMERKPNT